MSVDSSKLLPSSVSEEAFSKFLSEIEYPEKNKKWTWLLDNSPTVELFEWLCANVDSSNYLSEEELEEYTKLEEAGLILEDEDLDIALKEVLPENFELQDIGEDYIAALKDEQNYLENYVKSLEDVLNAEQHEVTSAQEEMSELENKTATLRKKLINAQSDCLAKTSLLESSMQQLHSHLIDLKKYSLSRGQDVADNRFLSEIPLFDYIKECDTFYHELDLNIEEAMLSPHLKGNSEILSEEAFSRKLEKAKEGLQGTLQFKAKETARQKGLAYACEHVKSVLRSRRLWEFSSNPCIVVERLAEQKRNLRIMEARAKQYGPIEIQVQGSVMEPHLQEIISKYVNKRCFRLEKLHKDIEIHQKQAVFDKLGRLQDELKNHCAINLVWLSLLGEEVTEIMNLFELAKSGEAFLMREQQDRIIRIENMKNIKDARNSDINKLETWSLMNDLTSYLKTYQDELFKSSSSLSYRMSTPDDISCSVKVITDYIEKYKGDSEELESMRKQISNSTLSSLMSRYKELKEFKSLICCGSTRDYPVIWTVNQIMFLFGFDAVSKKLKRRCKKLLAAYQGEKQLITVQENIFRNLWKKFFCNPEEIKALINSIDSL
ncbi:uncharacterized protein LOC124157906 isoform X2 [Ischnura elegans]|uniref:uncharacterized protein LOC124157906 isoform X2 n=1 Tax=Ischnura elegans TaxID=197161 RepID=UPI001ED8A720|nr:uncharacterized protein LOC124157906 isoform X2 [Ischnura elegans]